MSEPDNSVYYRNQLKDSSEGVCVCWNPVITFVFNRETMIVRATSAVARESYIGKPLSFVLGAMASIMKWPCAEINDNEYGSWIIPCLSG